MDGTAVGKCVGDTAPPFTSFKNPGPELTAPLQKELKGWVEDGAHTETVAAGMDNHQGEEDQIDKNKNLTDIAFAGR